MTLDTDKREIDTLIKRHDRLTTTWTSKPGWVASGQVQQKLFAPVAQLARAIALIYFGTFGSNYLFTSKEAKMHQCDCGKKFNSKRGLGVHKKYCNRSFEELGFGSRRERLIEDAHFACSQCGFNKTRPDGSTILEIDHIDGDPQNNEKNNLRVLCPNCHALTENFRNWGRTSTKKTSSRVRKGNACFDKDRQQRQSYADMKQHFNNEFIRIVKTAHETGEIDFSKFGWVSKLNEKFDETPQVTGKRLRRLMPDFYDESCFRRGYSKYKKLNAGLSERSKEQVL